ASPCVRPRLFPRLDTRSSPTLALDVGPAKSDCRAVACDVPRSGSHDALAAEAAASSSPTGARPQRSGMIAILIFAMSSWFGAALACGSDLRVTALKTEYGVNPLG